MPVPSDHTDIVADLQADPVVGDAWATEVLPRLPALQAVKAKELKAFQRVRGIRSSADLLRGLLAYVLEEYSSRAWAAWAVLIGLASISDRAWCARLRHANAWLLWLLSDLLAAPPPVIGHPSPARRIRLVDATRLRQVGGSGDDWRVHLAYDLVAGRLAQVTVSDHSRSEQFAHFDVQPGDLLIGDSGYGYRHNLAYVVGKGGDVVLRVYPPSFPLEDAHGASFDVLAWLLQPHGSLAEWQGWCRANGQRFAVRLVASKLPADKLAAAQKRKKRQAQKAGRRITAMTLVLAGWWVVITTLDSTDWPATEIVRLYQARWQIELVFKRMKQLLRVRTLRVKDVRAAEACVRALLLAWVLQEDIAAEVRGLLPSAARTAVQPASSWLLALLGTQTLRQQVRGQWTQARLRACIPQLCRLLVPSRRKRQQQEAALRDWLEARFRPVQPLQFAA